MGQNQFSESLVEMMLSWMRWLTSWFWNIVNSDEMSGGGFLEWFADNWLSLAIFLIIAGVIVDWIIWMIRWRPHWLWLRKRQIIYEEVPVKKRSQPQSRKKVNPRTASHMPRGSESEFDDPFAEDSDTDEVSDWDSADDPYSRGK